MGANLRCGRPDRSSTTWIRASSKGAAVGRQQHTAAVGNSSSGATRQEHSCKRHTCSNAQHHLQAVCEGTRAGPSLPVKSPKRWMPLRSPSACREGSTRHVGYSRQARTQLQACGAASSDMPAAAPRQAGRLLASPWQGTADWHPRESARYVDALGCKHRRHTSCRYKTSTLPT